ncbi:undecaprenyl/decaprenyl-phosphate alpha-N-acetylglucosaminyl 1-phosphate transferase [Flavobacteriaceae bacterium]|nr:undecaprenyl/decaprenyl-phosphate alpha-N-acetylglucosaminyl 1-phosphate transferase [Flavobacteriaceae bacterium]
MEVSSLVVAFIIATLIHFGVQKLFIYYKRFDDFNHRSSHKTLATRTGGIGIFLTVLIISLYHYFQGIELFDYSLFIPLGIMFVMGVYDDLYNADFKLKFLLQIIVAKILIDQGYVISNYHGLFGLYEVPWLLAQASTLFVFLVVVNAINFIDGIDGLAITEVIKIIAVFEFFSAGMTALAPLGPIIISSILPLYYFNFKKKRKVFLGDGGSMLLGTLTMVYVLYGLGNSYSFKQELIMNKTLFAVLVLLYPLIDLLRVFFLRIKEGKSPFAADNRHIHHLLLKLKLNPILICFLIISAELALITIFL